MIDIQTMMKESMSNHNRLYGPSARVHDYYESISKPRSAREMYRGASNFGHHSRVRTHTAKAQPTAVAAPSTHLGHVGAVGTVGTVGTADPRRNLNDFYFYYTFIENGRTYVVFKKHVFLVMLLVVSVGIGVLALDVRRLFLFLAKGLQASLASVIS